MTAITGEVHNYGFVIKALRSVLKNRTEYLVTGPTRGEVRQQGRDIKFIGGWRKRGSIKYSSVTRNFYQWWDRVEQSRQPESNDE